MNLNTGQSTRGFHRLSMYQECPQKFAYSNILNLKPKKSGFELGLGTLVHIGLAHRYAIQMGQDELDPIVAMEQYAQENFMTGVLGSAKDLYVAYDKRWTQEDFVAVDVEREFRINVAEELYTQRVDLVAKMDGKIIFIDHKTYGKYKSKWETRGQFMGLMVLGRNLVPETYNVPFGGIWVNEICTMKNRVAFDRKKVDTPISVSDAFVYNIKRSYEEIKLLEEKDPWAYPKNFSACEGKYGRGCEYMSLCTKGKFALEEYR